jgi:hypothetical protein
MEPSLLPPYFGNPLLQIPRDIEAMDIALWIKMHGPSNSITFIYKPTTRGRQIVHAHLKHSLDCKIGSGFKYVPHLAKPCPINFQVFISCNGIMHSHCNATINLLMVYVFELCNLHACNSFLEFEPEFLCCNNVVNT